MKVEAADIEKSQVESGIAIWFLGGPSLAVRTAELIVYLDLFTGPAPVSVVTKAIPEVIDPASIRRADLAISTHHDEDHCHQESLTWLHKNTDCTFLGPVSCNKLYRKWNFDASRTRQIAAWETFSLGDLRIHALPARDAFDPDAVSFVLETEDVRVFDGGDSLYFPGMADVGQRWDLDMAILSFAKSPPDQVIYLDEKAVHKAASELQPRILILKHYDLWEEFSVDPMPLVDELRENGIDARVFGLGERLDYRGAD